MPDHHRWLRALAVALIALSAVARAQDPAWTQTFDMSRDPACGGWFGAGTRHELADGVMRVVDGSSEGGCGHCFIVDWEANPETEATAEARLKVVSSQGDAGVALWVSNGVNEEGIQFTTDGLNLAFAGTKYALDTTADFHVYRVTIQGLDLKLYVDGKLAVDGAGKFTHVAHQGRSQLGFGSASSAARGESLWDYVRFRSPLRPQLGAAPPGAEQVTIFREPDTYAVFPGLAHDPATGRLSVAFRAGGPRSHIDGKGSRTVTMVSDDGGKTWREGPMLPSPPFTGPNGVQVRVRCKWWQEHPAEERQALKDKGYLVQDVRPGVVAICAGAVCDRSTDGGKTWTSRDIEMPFMACLASGMNSQQLADGTILFPTYGSVKDGDHDSSWLLRSTDCGLSWQHILVGLKPGLHLNEPAIIECQNGRLLTVMRTGMGNDHLWQAVSDDRGATWHGLEDTGLKGHPPDLLRLRDGRILLSYGYRHDPLGIHCAVSSDEGESWDLEHLWTLRGGGGSFDLGYPHSVQLKDGAVVTVYYFVEPGGMQFIAATRWRVP
ncbi:MAG: exo-alpha-sialidase [Armatimonadetes bacterium]|nr:exo-alpha-sialidase [Armatimonadota bacterium]